MSGRVIVAALAAGSVAWAALVVLAPDLPPALAAIVYGIGGVVCHQRPERSFYLWSTQFPVCARCAGIYAGAALGVIAELVRLKPPLVRLKPDATSDAVAVRPATSGFRRTS